MCILRRRNGGASVCKLNAPEKKEVGNCGDDCTMPSQPCISYHARWETDVLFGELTNTMFGSFNCFASCPALA